MIAVRDIAWAAGFLEGEGSFSCPRVSPSVQAAQVNRDPLDRLHTMFGGAIYALRPNSKHGRPYFRWDINGQRAAAVMMTVVALMSEKRRSQIVAALAPWKAAGTGRGAHQRGRTHCPKGHPYAGENLILLAGGRACRECVNSNRRAARAARAA